MWREAVALEPGLADLLREVRKVRDLDPGGPAFCRFATWQPFKARMRALLHRHRRQLLGRHREIHDECYRVLFRELPECRGCWCGAREEAQEEALADWEEEVEHAHIWNRE